MMNDHFMLNDFNFRMIKNILNAATTIFQWVQA